MQLFQEIFKVIIKDEETGSFLLPTFIYDRYRLINARLGNVDCILIYPKEDLDPLPSLIRHMEKIADSAKKPPVLVVDHLNTRQKTGLLKKRFAFIVGEKQFFLPFLGAYLTNSDSDDKPVQHRLLPSAQVLLLYFIYNNCKELAIAKAAEHLSFSLMSMSRSSLQLQELGLIRIQKRGRKNYLVSDKGPEDMFETAKKFMSNPVKKTIYVPKYTNCSEFPLSSHSALSRHSMLARPSFVTRATDSVKALESEATSMLVDPDEQIAVELWRYDPQKLRNSETVDPLSLVLSLLENPDERTEQAVEEMLNSLWKQIEMDNVKK